MRLVALLIVLLLCAPASIAAAAGVPTTTTQLEPTAPWLTQTSPAGAPGRTTTATAPSTTTTPQASTRSTTTATVSRPRDLPYTGDDLLPEAIAAVLLIGTGIAIRLRPRWR